MSERRYAVLIASSQFDDKRLQNLRCPENDVDGLSKILISQKLGGFSEVLLSKNEPHYQVMGEINRVINKAEKNDLVLIYYSGHGKLNLTGNLHLATANTDVDILDTTSIPIDSLKNLVVNISRTNRTIIILDCCYSGTAGQAFARGGVDDQLQSLSRGRGTYILTASTGSQTALEKESDSNGVFTKHLIEGLQSRKATDEEGNVTMSSLYSYLREKISEEAGQEPMKWDLGIQGGDIVLISLGKRTTPRKDKKGTGPVNGSIIPDNIADLLKKGVDLIEQTKYNEAINNYNKVIDLDATLPDGWYGKGNCLFKLKKFKEANKNFDKAIELNPEFGLAWKKKGLSLEGLGRREDVQEAIKCLDTALEIDPEDEEAYYIKSLLLAYDYKKSEEALACSEKAIELDPNDPGGWIAKGIALSNLGKYDESLKYFNKALEINPNSSRALRSKAYTLFFLKDYDQALANVDQALKIDSNDFRTWYTKALIFNVMKKFNEALKSVEKVNELNPDYINGWSELGLLYYNMGKYDESLSYASKTIIMDPTDVRGWYTKSLVLFATKKYPDALKSVEKLLELSPGDGAFSDLKERILKKLGK